MSTRVRRARKLTEEAQRLLLLEIEERARKILRQNKNLEEFIMAMGSAFFTTKDWDNIDVSERAYMKPVWNILDEFADYKLEGVPMRFTADGPKITDW